MLYVKQFKKYKNNNINNLCVRKLLGAKNIQMRYKNVNQCCSIFFQTKCIALYYYRILLIIAGLT